jgi:hypothetical protein
VKDVVLKHSGIRLTFHRRGPADPQVTAIAKQARKGRPPKDSSPEARAITKATFSANLTWLMRNVKKGREVFIRLLEYRASIAGADADPRLLDLLKRWHELPPREQRKVNLDALCLEYGISPPEAFGWYAEESLKHSKNLVQTMLAAASGDIVEASIERAKDVEHGHAERKMVLQSLGVLANGNRFAVQNNVLMPPQPDAPKMVPIGAAPGEVRQVSHEDGQRAVQGVLRDRFKSLSPAPVSREVPTVPDVVEAETVVRKHVRDGDR